MTATRHPSTVTYRTGLTRRSGYVVAIAVNVLMLYVANNLLAWNVLPFLTSDFGKVLWLIDLSLLATILANAAYFWYDHAWLRSSGQIALNAISLGVAVRMYQVFPFDFSGSQFDWAPVARAVIIFTILGTAVGMMVELLRLIRLGLRGEVPISADH